MRDGYRLSAADLDRLVNAAPAATELSWAVKDLLLAHYELEGYATTLQSVRGELDYYRNEMCECGHLLNAHRYHGHVIGTVEPDHCACCPSTCLHFRPVQTTRAEVDRLREALTLATDLITAELTKPHGAQVFRDTLAKIHELSTAAPEK
jgi:hypothetical protein